MTRSYVEHATTTGIADNIGSQGPRRRSICPTDRLLRSVPLFDRAGRIPQPGGQEYTDLMRARLCMLGSVRRLTDEGRAARTLPWCSAAIPLFNTFMNADRERSRTGTGSRRSTVAGYAPALQERSDPPAWRSPARARTGSGSRSLRALEQRPALRDRRVRPPGADRGAGFGSDKGRAMHEIA